MSRERSRVIRHRLKTIDHIGVVVDDLDEGKRFLQLIGFEHVRSLALKDKQLHASFWRCGGCMVELIQMDDAEANSRRLKGERSARIEHIAIEVDDLDATIDELSSHGIRFTSVPTRIGDNLNVWSEAETSDGYQLQLFQRIQTADRRRRP